MTVESKRIENPPPSLARPSARPRVGFLRPGQVERAFIGLLYFALLMLVVLSVIGTFYGRAGVSAPINTPLQMVRDMAAAPQQLGIALAIQFVLTLIQYGARQMARRDRRWWILYLVSLGISVYYNFQAYQEPLSALLPWYVAWLLIIAGDVLPEYIAIKQE